MNFNEQIVFARIMSKIAAQKFQTPPIRVEKNVTVPKGLVSGEAGPIVKGIQNQQAREQKILNDEKKIVEEGLKKREQAKPAAPGKPPEQPTGKPPEQPKPFDPTKSKKLAMPLLKVGRAQLHIELADTPLERAVGLMGRESLDEDQGMLFVFEHPQKLGFWMKDTPLPLSIAFIDQAGTILETRDLQPHSTDTVFSARDNTKYALEVNQGWFERNEVKAGDKLAEMDVTTDDIAKPVLEKGKEVEKEHTDIPKEQAEVVTDHASELAKPDDTKKEITAKTDKYYNGLQRLEQRIKQGGLNKLAGSLRSKGFEV